MSEEINNEESMQDMMQQYEFKKIHTGDIIKGKVLKVTDSEVFVNINYFSDGVIPKNEITPYEDEDLNSIIKENDEIDVMIIKSDDGEGNVLLSKIKADGIKGLEELEEVYNTQKSMEVLVKEAVKGGVIGYYKGIRIFIPASQLALHYVEDLKEFVGKELQVRITEFDEEKSKIVASRKVIEKEEAENKKDRLWKTIKKGEKREGKVTRIVKFGAFVDIGGLEGLVHISDLSWSRIQNPNEVVSEGDKVTVYVQDIDINRQRLSLAIKDVNINPWKEVKNKFKVNDVVQGKVTKFISVGAFVEINPGVEGLVHNSEITEENIAKPSDILKLGEIVNVKIIDIDYSNNRISLSIKNASESSKEYLKYNDEKEDVTIGDLLKDKLKNFKFD
ncbi:SSU ribosomal protein S1P [Clostridium amylolyticum]|uniref:SSU ribosomal protein S1P n=1 Tax=Clostridium amylolyticum TaxID=1121298 RepID=A0A1M6BE30_9CLOT|nr:30S ribosomal protein S1 [Clostridium amylolyticum]SHI46818.1 SSU ribosomal protein S1P [Clostridium amylolyticum]